jgi:hypothetical protein
MKAPPENIENAADALLFCDYLGRFGGGDYAKYYRGIADVIRDLMHRVESQAMAMERSEAAKDSAQ